MASALRAGLLHSVAKPLFFSLCLLPLVWLVYAALTNQLGANPAESLIRSTGDWTLRFLCLVLAITPLRILTDTPVLARFRRMLGLFVYFYGVLHMLSYAWLDMGLQISEIANDILKRPFILVGFISMLVLSALAATSFNQAIKYLGGKRWQLLHRAVYFVAFLALLHFFWMRSGKNDFGEVFIYALILGTLLTWRLFRFLASRKASSARLKRT